MSQAPSMPVFVDAMLADTLHLTRGELGAYHLILYATWRNNGEPLEDDGDRMARICRATPAEWRKIRDVLAPFFDLGGGTWRQKRLEKEWGYVVDRASRARRNGQTGGRPRQTQNEPSGFPEENPERTQRQSPHTHTQSQSKSDMFRRECVRVRNKVLSIIGGDPEDPKWHTGIARVEMWLNAGISAENVIFPAMQCYAARPPPGFPHSFAYLEKVVFSYRAEVDRPLPESKNGSSPDAKPTRPTAEQRIAADLRIIAETCGIAPGGLDPGVHPAGGIILDHDPG